MSSKPTATNNNLDETTPLLSSTSSRRSPTHTTSSSISRTLVTPAEGHVPAETEEEDLTNPQTLTKKSRNFILFAVWVGVFLGAVDTTVVASLSTDISSDFKASNQASWLGTSYLLSTACFTPLYSRLADIIGRRHSTLLAISLFFIGTLGCGLAPSMNWFIVARLIAGSGGGGIMSLSSITASDLIPLKQRALAQGIANIFFGAGSGLGGPLGGFISDAFGWRIAFLAQVPLLAISFSLVFWKVRYIVPGQGKSKKESFARIDYAGSATLIVTLASFLFSLSNKNNENLPWSDPMVWSLLIVAVVFGCAFVWVEARWAIEPVMPLRILKTRNGIFVALANFTTSFVTFSILYFYPAFFEIVKQVSASRSGAHLLPNSVALSCGSLFAGWWIRRTGHYYRVILITAFLPIVALVSMILLTEHSSPLHEWLGIVPAGFGFASIITATLTALLSAVPRSDIATATGITYLARYIGQVVGVAVSSSVLQNVLNTVLHKRIKGDGSEQLIDQIRHVSNIIPSLPSHVQKQARASYLDALRAVFILNAAVAILTFLSCVPLKEYALPSSFAEEHDRRNGNAGNGNGNARDRSQDQDRDA